MDERDSSLVEQERDLCVCKPYMSNMKAISFEAIRSRTKFLRIQVSHTAEWFKCKYCDCKICCRIDDEEEVEFESWSSVVYGVHRDHPPGCKVRPIPCYFEMVVRQMMANKITGARLAAAVNEFFQYDLITLCKIRKNIFKAVAAPPEHDSTPTTFGKPLADSSERKLHCRASVH